MRSDGRLAEQLRPTRITNYLMHAEGLGPRRSGQDQGDLHRQRGGSRAPFRRNSGKGWVTAEADMLRATTTRSQREASAGKVGGRTQEIQRLIGRSLKRHQARGDR